MNNANAKRLFFYLTIGLLIIGFNASGFAGGSFSIKWGGDSEPDSPSVAKKHQKQGPPAHAPAHGYRAKHSYRYYPSSSVYYDTGRELYFYLKGDNWEFGASLPGNLRVQLGDYVSMELDTDKPYVYHSDHIKKYPPGQVKDKDKKKKKWG